MKNKIIKNGFTLVELLVVISIMGILTVISLASFTSAQVKARDSQRKSDLDQISKSLMMYYNDNGKFPDYSAIATKGKLTFGDESIGFVSTDGNTIYMRKTPKELRSGWPAYIYEVSVSKKSFNLFADLENRKDSQCSQNQDGTGTWLKSNNDYCYGVASPNTTVGDVTP